MKKHMLKIEFEAQEGALLRLLGLIQRRGFSVEAVGMPETEELCKSVHLTLSPMGPSYRIEVLQKQIERLLEVRNVTVGAQRQPRRVLGFLRRPAAEAPARMALS